MSNDKRIRNFRLLNGMGESEEIIRIRDRRTISPSNFPFKILASKTFNPIDERANNKKITDSNFFLYINNITIETNINHL
jgi:hypothetical protein